jgi:hypothetical protein
VEWLQLAVIWSRKDISVTGVMTGTVFTVKSGDGKRFKKKQEKLLDNSIVKSLFAEVLKSKIQY